RFIPAMTSAVVEAAPKPEPRGSCNVLMSLPPEFVLLHCRRPVGTPVYGSQSSGTVFRSILVCVLSRHGFSPAYDSCVRVVEDAACVVGVVAFGTIRRGAAAHAQKHLGRAAHAQRRCDAIHPDRYPH